MDAFNVSFQDQSLQFVDGKTLPSYDEGYKGYKQIHAIGKNNSIPNSISPLAGVDTYLRGNQFASNGSANTYMEVVGPPTLPHGTSNLYSIRVWLASSLPQSGYGSNITSVHFAGTSGDSDVYAQQVYPISSGGGGGGLSVSLSIAYQAFSVSIGYSAASVTSWTNNGNSWTHDQNGAWSPSSNQYSSSNIGNGFASQASLYASGGTTHKGSHTGTATANLQITNYGGGGSMVSYWLNNSCTWTYTIS
ncbi:hypothetical protein [Paenibacillus yonginensis]|uniref:hypothetical protein n=1 Tax=Paenibacillus yonginensis TaxID=1462996 RepID=UPI0014721EC2|nr:hypothetical protein [Paenibacillus yonginensis]